MRLPARPIAAAAPGRSRPCITPSSLAIVGRPPRLGASLPTEALPSFAVQVALAGTTPEALARKLRQGDPPIFGRISKDHLLLDLRTVVPAEIEVIAAALNNLDG